MAENTPDKAPGAFSLLGTASTMGLHMVSGPIVGGGLGWLVDQGLDSWPIASGIGVLLGLAAGFRNVWADARYLERSNAAHDAEKKKQEDAARETAEKERKTSGQTRSLPIVPIVHKSERAEVKPAQTGDMEEAAEDTFTAALLAGNAASEERELEELDETLEAIRMALKADEDCSVKDVLAQKKR